MKMRRKQLNKLRKQVAQYKRKRSDAGTSDLAREYHSLISKYREVTSQLVNTIIQQRPFRVNVKHYQQAPLIPRIKMKQRRHRQRPHYQQVELIPKVQMKQRRHVERHHYDTVELLQDDTRELLPIKHYSYIDLIEEPQMSSESFERQQYEPMELPEQYQTMVSSVICADLVVTGTTTYEYVNVHELEIQLPFSQEQYNVRIDDLADAMISYAHASTGSGLYKLMHDSQWLEMDIRQYAVYEFNNELERAQLIQLANQPSDRLTGRALLKAVYDASVPSKSVNSIAEQYHAVGYDTGKHGK